MQQLIQAIKAMKSASSVAPTQVLQPREIVLSLSEMVCHALGRCHQRP